MSATGGSQSGGAAAGGVAFLYVLGQELALVAVGGEEVEEALKAVQKPSPQAIVLVSLSGTTANAIRALRKSGYTGSFMAFSIVATCS